MVSIPENKLQRKDGYNTAISNVGLCREIIVYGYSYGYLTHV